MSKKYTNIARSFLNESVGFRENFEMLDALLEHLMEKNDPEPCEIALVETLTQFFEKYKLLENNLREFVNADNSKSLGNILDKLYDGESLDGFSRKFKK